MAQEEEEWTEKDPRFDFILQYLIQTNKLKTDLWIKMKADPNYLVKLKKIFPFNHNKSLHANIFKLTWKIIH